MVLSNTHHQYRLFRALFFGGTILSAFFLLPIAGVTFTLPKLVLFSLTATVGTLWLLMRDDVDTLAFFTRHWIGRFLLFYIFVLALSIAWSVAPFVSLFGSPPRFEGLLTHFVYLSFAVCGLALSQHPRGLRNLNKTILYANGLIVFYGVLQMIGLDPLDALWVHSAFLGRTFSVLGHPNALGAFIVLTLPFVAFKAISVQGTKQTTLYSVLAVANLVVLLGTASRAALLAFGVTAVVFGSLAQTLMQNTINQMRSATKAFCVILMIVLVSLAMFSYGQRFGRMTERGRSWGTRQVIMHDTLKMVQERPQGYGLESLIFSYPRFMSPWLHETKSLTTSIDRAHSKPVDLLVSVGPLGVLAYYTFLAALLAAAYRLRRRRGAIFAGGLGILGYSTAMLAGFDSIVTAVFFWLIVGLTMGLIWQEEGDRETPVGIILPRFVMLLLSCICICSAVLSTQWTRQRITMQAAQQLFVEGRLSQSLATYYDASLQFVFDRTLLTRFAETGLIALEQTDDPETQETLSQATDLALSKLSVLTNKQDGYAPLLRAWHAALKGHPEEFETYYIQAKHLLPATVDTYRIGAHTYGLLGDRAGSNAAYADLINLLPDYWRDNTSPEGQVLWKENPWLFELVGRGVLRGEEQWDL